MNPLNTLKGEYMKKSLKVSSFYILVGIALVLAVLRTATNSGDVLAQ